MDPFIYTVIAYAYAAIAAAVAGGLLVWYDKPMGPADLITQLSFACITACVWPLTLSFIAGAYARQGGWV